MTKAEYAEYKQAVANFFEREGIANLLCWDSDPFLSWCPCDCCGRPEGGDREEASGYNPTTEKVQTYECVCLDCIYYCVNDQLDDATMDEIERESHE